MVKTTTTYSKRHRLKNREGPPSDSYSQLGSDRNPNQAYLEREDRIPGTYSRLSGSTALHLNLSKPKHHPQDPRTSTDGPNYTQDVDRGASSRLSGSSASALEPAKKRKRTADARPDTSFKVHRDRDPQFPIPHTSTGSELRPKEDLTLFRGSQLSRDDAGPFESDSKLTKKRKHSAETDPTSIQPKQDLGFDQPAKSSQPARSVNPEPPNKRKRTAAPGPSLALNLNLNHTESHSKRGGSAPSPSVTQLSRVLAAGSAKTEPTNNAKRKRGADSQLDPTQAHDPALAHPNSEATSKPDPNPEPKPKPKPRPRKKQKLAQEVHAPATAVASDTVPAPNTTMSLQPFQTPFPTLQAQSQVFRLPSSKPQPSPEEGAVALGLGHGLLAASPAIIGVPQQKPKTKVQKENQNQNQTRKSGNTTSRTSETLKSTRTHGDLSKTLTSLTLTSEGLAFPSRSHSHSRPNSRLSRRHHTATEQGSRPSSRSTSCSSRSSASAASHHYQQKSKSKSNHRPIPRLKHTQSLTSLNPKARDNDLDNGNDIVNDDTKKPRKNRKPSKAKNKKTKFPSSRTLSSGPISDENVLLLASPFVSRASSPVDGGSASKAKVQVGRDHEAVVVNRAGVEIMGPPPVPGIDVGDKVRKRASSGGSGLRTALADLEYNPNLPQPRPRQGLGPGPYLKSQSAHASPEKPDKIEKIDFTKLDSAKSKSKSKSKSRMSIHPAFASRAENRPPRATELTSERERRPSAPSWLHPPKMKKRISDLGPRAGDKDANEGEGEGGGGGKGPWARQKLRLSSGLNIVLDSKARATEAPTTEPSTREPKKQRIALEVNQNPDPDPGAEDSDPMDWMHSRRDVDFNRPPSRMSIGGSGFGCDYEYEDGFEYGFEYGEVEGGCDDDVFFDSSSSSASENEDEAVEEDDEEAGAGRQKGPRKRRISPLDLNWDVDLHAGMSVDEKFEALFGKDVVKASTPAKMKTGVAMGLQFLSGGTRFDMGGDGKEKKAATKPATLDDQDDEDREGEADMDLTADAASAAIKVSSPPVPLPPSQLQDGRRSQSGKQRADADKVDQVHGASDSLDADFTSWVTDSIISPPTVYLAKLKNKDRQSVGDDNAHRHGLRAPVPERGPGPMRLSSPFRPSEGGAGSGTEMGANTSLNGLSATEPPDDLEQTLGHYEESTSESSDTARPTHTAQYHNQNQSKGVDEQRLAAANAKRTRSGTIVPLAPPGGPPGARRTRGGTIIGPLPPAPAPEKPLPAVPDSAHGLLAPLAAEPRRTRSGTIVPSSSAVGNGAGASAGGSGLGLGRRTRSGSVLQVKSKGMHAPNTNLNLAMDKVPSALHVDMEGAVNDFDHIDPHGLDPDEHADQDAALDVVDCYIDSVYLPPLMSSPDPIDFLRFASIVEEEDVDEEEGRLGLGLSLGLKDLNWRVAEDPPSPEVMKNVDKGKKAGGSGFFRGGRFRNFGRKLGGRAGGGDARGKGKKRARFLGLEGQEEEAEGSDTALHGLADEEMSDDELLLLPGQTAGLWV